MLVLRLCFVGRGRGRYNVYIVILAGLEMATQGLIRNGYFHAAAWCGIMEAPVFFVVWNIVGNYRNKPDGLAIFPVIRLHEPGILLLFSWPPL